MNTAAKSVVKSPLNYTGNKERIFNQMLPFFPKDAKIAVDLFCGGGSVGLNLNAKNTIFIEKNERVISLLEFLAKSEFETLLNSMQKMIKKYNLSHSANDGYASFVTQNSNKNNGLKEFNKLGFYEMRNDYNSLGDKFSAKANLLLYLLLLYGFNNDLRFNANGEFNLPCGKTDLNKKNIEKLRLFMQKTKEKT